MGFSLGGLLKFVSPVARGAIGLVPGGSLALKGYDAYNTAVGRTGAFSPPQLVRGRDPELRLGTGNKPIGGPPPLQLGGGSGVVSGGGLLNRAAVAVGAMKRPQGPPTLPPVSIGGRRVGRGNFGTARILPSGYRKSRRMRVTNVHALRRAIRRVKGAEHLFRKVLGLTHPHHTGTVHIRAGRKRR